MVTQAWAILLSFALQAASTPQHYHQSVLTLAGASCPTNAHIVGVRGTTEDPGFGAMQPIVNQLLQKMPGSDAYPIDYPAEGLLRHSPWFQPFKYPGSEQTGVDNLNAHIMNFTANCPDTKIVLLGYSQVSVLSTVTRSRGSWMANQILANHREPTLLATRSAVEEARACSPSTVSGSQVHDFRWAFLRFYVPC